MTLDEGLHNSEPQFPHLQTGDPLPHHTALAGPEKGAGRRGRVGMTGMDGTWHLCFLLPQRSQPVRDLGGGQESARQRWGNGCSRRREQHAQGGTLGDGGNVPAPSQAFEDTWRWIVLYPLETPTAHGPAGRPPALHLPEGCQPPAPPAGDFTVPPSPCGHHQRHTAGPGPDPNAPSACPLARAGATGPARSHSGSRKERTRPLQPGLLGPALDPACSWHSVGPTDQEEGELT